MSKFLLSVVIPTFNEEKLLPGCLDSIKNQQYQGKVNVIISDNGSTDNTLKIAKKYHCHIITTSKNKNIGSARKLGFIKAKDLAKKSPKLKEILINTDADTKLNQNYFNAVIKTFKDPSIMAASGPFAINQPKIPLKKFGRFTIFLHGLSAFFDLKLPWFFFKIFNNSFIYGANSCLRR